MSVTLPAPTRRQRLALVIGVGIALSGIAAGNATALTESAGDQPLVFPGGVVVVTPVDLPDGVTISVGYVDEQEAWPAGWVCVDEPQDDPGTVVEACADPDQIAADYPGVPTHPADA